MDKLDQNISYCSTTNTLGIENANYKVSMTGGGASGSNYCYDPFGFHEYWQPNYYPSYIHYEIPVDRYQKAFEVAKMLMKEYLKEIKLSDFMKMVDQIAEKI